MHARKIKSRIDGTKISQRSEWIVREYESCTENEYNSRTSCWLEVSFRDREAIFSGITPYDFNVAGIQSAVCQNSNLPMRLWKHPVDGRSEERLLTEYHNS